MHRCFPFIAMNLILLAVSAGSAAEPPVSAEQAEFFEKRIRPALVEHCLSCHGEKKQEGGLRLDSRESLLKGSDSGPVVVAGKPSESELIDAVKQTGDL